MKPGRELDCLIAGIVNGYDKQIMPDYSTDMAAAWTLTGRIPRFNISRLDNGKWRILLTMPGESRLDVKALIQANGKDLLKMKMVEGESAAHVICLALLEVLR